MIGKILGSRVTLLALLLALQALCSFHAFPVQELAPRQPLMAIDHGAHYHGTAQSLAFLRHSGRMWGYDPQFMAGYPTAMVHIDNNGVSLLAGLLALVMPLALALKVVLMGALLALPLLVCWSCRNLGRPASEALLAGYLTLLTLNLSPWYATLLDYGLYSFLLATVAALVAYSLAHRHLQRGGWGALAGFAGVAWFAQALHPLGGPLLALLLLLMLLTGGRASFCGPRSRRLAALVTGGLLALAGNLFWILPLLRFRHYYFNPYPGHLQGPGWQGLLTHLADPRQGLFFLLLAAALISPLFFLRRGRSRGDVGPALVCWIVWVAGFSAAYLGQSLLQTLEPGRFLMLTILLTPLLLARALYRAAGGRRRVLAGLVAAALAFQALAWPPDLAQATGLDGALIWWRHERDQLAMDVSRCLAPLTTAIRQKTHSGRRILIEDRAHGPYTCHSHFLYGLAAETGREFIGGPYHWLRIKQHFASFTDGEAFGQRIDTMPEARLMRYLELYNIGWAAAHSVDGQRPFLRWPDRFQPLGRYNGYSLFRVHTSGSYFIQGSGRLSARPDRILISDASAGTIVLRYHYLETLRTRPPLPLSRHQAEDDPVGFIEIDNRAGARRIEITHQGGWSQASAGAKNMR